jgi:putative peptide zinc metalloprotease protein
MERPTFSPFWHRVRATTPRLRSHVQVTRQFYRGRRWLVAHDPTNNSFYRLTPIAHELVTLLDGRRTVDDAWQVVLGKHGDLAPTQPEVIELIGQLYSSNLLQVDASPETQQLLTRGRDRVQKRFAQQALSIMYFKLRLINPDPLLTWLEPVFRPVLNRWGLVAWAALVLFALWQVLPSWPRLVGQFDSVTSPSSWGWMLGTFVVLKLWHELGHGIICKRLGGQVPEAGVMLLVLLPSPYVDASSAWSFPSRWQRIAVGAGGMMFELAAAAVAALVWLNTQPGELVNQIAYYAIFSASVATVLFNANPLMKFDGYYMLSDYLGIPNMMQRSGKLLTGLFQKHVYRLKNVRPVTDQPGEWWTLLVFGVLSQVYRVVIFLSITLFLLGQWFGLGLVLAVWTVAAWALMPLGKLVHWLASSSQLSEHRARAVLTTLAMVGAGLALIGVVRVPDWRRTTGVVEAREQAGVFAGADGFVEQAFATLGQRVVRGEVLATLTSPELAARTDLARAELAEVTAQLRAARAQGEPAAERVFAQRVEQTQGELADLIRQASELRVVAPIDGVIVSNDPRSMLGRRLAKGEALCEIVEPRDVRIHAVMSQGDADWLFGLPPEQRTARLRLASNIQTPIDATIQEIIPAGQRLLPHAALGYVGGGQAATDADDKSGRRATAPLFSVRLDAGAALEGALPGQRAFLRFTLPSRSVAAQAWDRLTKLVQGRVNL